MSILDAQHLTHTYRIGGREIRVLDTVSLSVAAGEFLVIQGASGSGKSTLLSLLSGLEKPGNGRIRIDGRDITDLDEDELAPIRNTTIGFVFQAYHLVPALTAIENVMFPAELRGDAAAAEKAAVLLKRVGLEDRRDSFPHQLSGGEKQRIAICRALINAPAIIFADEPTGNLDSVSGQVILALLREFQQERGAALVLVTHNPDIAATADRVLKLVDGRLHRERPHAA
ncbi:MAG: ABC transporter ATP-binding protein [Desulfobacterales bacterium]|jgi:putative ABC transport system ATP-binding protein|nr:ABC transporter ATP-binding protein [Desulfobacteraceae bacterium]MDY0311791.1 ABC transporter ATP-binding protein [Desulfobacterales bacterium]